MSTPKTITVKLTDPKLYVYPPEKRLKPRGAEVVKGAGTFEVPDVSYWRRRVRDGTLELVGGSKAKSKAEPKQEPKATAPAKSDKGKAAKE